MTKHTTLKRKTGIEARLLFVFFITFIGRIGDVAQVAAVESQRPGAKSPKPAEGRGSDLRAFPKIACETVKIKIDGGCFDEEGEPIRIARIRLYRYENSFSKPELVRLISPNVQGEFEFPEIDFPLALDEDSPDSYWLIPSYVLTATSPGKTVSLQLVRPVDGRFHAKFELDKNPQSLSGRIVDRTGRPVAGVTIHMQHRYEIPIEGVMSAVTDESGNYEIPGLRTWGNKDPNNLARSSIMISHPEFGNSHGWYSAVPQVKDIVLDEPSIIEGQVFDTVRDRPAANVLVSAQGVARHGWYQTITDREGRYKLLTIKDHYNIWSNLEDRIAIAAKAIPAVSGEKTENANIRLVRGGFVEGKGLNPGTYVANYGPAKPRTGAAVNSSKVKPDGTFRLRVAPGNNYIYLMAGNGSQYLSIEDGQTVQCKWDAEIPQKIRDEFQKDISLQSELLEQALDEDQAVEAQRHVKAIGR